MSEGWLTINGVKTPFVQLEQTHKSKTWMLDNTYKIRVDLGDNMKFDDQGNDVYIGKIPPPPKQVGIVSDWFIANISPTSTMQDQQYVNAVTIYWNTHHDEDDQVHHNTDYTDKLSEVMGALCDALDNPSFMHANCCYDFEDWAKQYLYNDGSDDSE